MQGALQGDRQKNGETSYELENRCVLRPLLKDNTVLAFLMGAGRPFHSREAAVEKALSPVCLRDLFTTREIAS